MFYDELKSICNREGTTITTVLNNLNMSTGSIGRWKNGVTPNMKTVQKIAEYLSVSPDELLGIEKKPPAKATVTDNDIKVALFGGDGEVTDEMWEEVKSFAEYVKHKKINDN